MGTGQTLDGVAGLGQYSINLATGTAVAIGNKNMLILTAILGLIFSRSLWGINLGLLCNSASKHCRSIWLQPLSFCSQTISRASAPQAITNNFAGTPESVIRLSVVIRQPLGPCVPAPAESRWSLHLPHRGSRHRRPPQCQTPH